MKYIYSYIELTLFSIITILTMCPFSDSRQIYKNQFDKKEKEEKKKDSFAKKSQTYTYFVPLLPFSYY